MRVTSNMSANNSVYNLQLGRNRLDKLQETITSGQNVNRPSDDPISSRTLLDIGDKLKAYDQYSANNVKAKSWMQINNTALTAMNDILTQTKSLMNSFTSGSTDPNERQNIHDQLSDLKKQIIDMANTQYGDQYIFGGADNLVAPYTQNDPTNTYAGDSTERTIEIAQGTTQPISLTGDSFLTSTTPPKTNILQMYDDLMTAVGDSNPANPGNPAALATASQLLNPASAQIFSAINTNLSRMTRVENMAKLNESNKNTLSSIVGNIQNVDMIKVGVQLNTEKNAFDASLSATSQLMKLSLLDYM